MRLGQTSVIHYVSRVTASILGFSATLLIARLLGAEVLGSYYLATATVAWLNIGGQMGLFSAITKRISEGDEQFAYAAAGIAVIGFLSLVVSAGVYTFKGSVNSYIGSTVAPLLILMFVANISFGVVGSLLNGHDLVHVSGLLSPIKTGSRALLQIGAILTGLGLAGLLLGYVGGFLLVTIIGGVIAVRQFHTVIRPERKHFQRLLSYSKYSWLGSIRYRAFNWVDILVLGIFVQSSLVGVYSAAWNISSFLLLFGSSVSQSVFPEISRVSAKEGPDAVGNIFEDALSYGGLLLIPGLVGGTILGERIFRIFGDEFTKGTVVLSVLIVSCLLQAYWLQFTTTLNAIDRPDLAFRVNGIFIAGNVILNFVLVYLFGWIGAAVATTSSVGISLVVAYRYLSTILEFSVPISEIGRQGIAAAVMGIVVYLGVWIEETYSVINYNAIVVLGLVGIGALVYIAILFGISQKFRETVVENAPIDLPIPAR